MNIEFEGVSAYRKEIFAFDIETVAQDEIPDELITVPRNLKDPLKIAAAKEEFINKAALDPGIAKIIFAGFLMSTKLYDYVTGLSGFYTPDAWQTIKTDNTVYMCIGWDFDKPERDMLVELLKLFGCLTSTGAQLTTFNGKSFDMPYMLYRMTVHKIIPKKYSRAFHKVPFTEYCLRYSSANYDVYADGLIGCGQHSLRYHATAIPWLQQDNVPKPTSGDTIAEMYKNKDAEAIKLKNYADVFYTYSLADFLMEIQEGEFSI